MRTDKQTWVLDSFFQDLISFIMLCAMGFAPLFFGPAFLDRPDDLGITRAPAKVATDIFADLLFRRMRVLVEQSFPHNHHSGCTESALDGPVFQKGFLDRVELPIGPGDPFDRHDLTPIQTNRQEQTGQHGRPVDEDRTGATFANAAPILCARKSQLISQDVEE
jgi:hypothetical protein